MVFKYMLVTVCHVTINCSSCMNGWFWVENETAQDQNLSNFIAIVSIESCCWLKKNKISEQVYFIPSLLTVEEDVFRKHFFAACKALQFNNIFQHYRLKLGFFFHYRNCLHSFSCQWRHYLLI